MAAASVATASVATASVASSVLQTTSGKTNFQRLTRLLIAGGTSVLRELFDSIHSPSTLPLVLASPAVKAQLRGARLTKPQRDCLYPAPGRYGKSSDFKITLLLCLLRHICGHTTKIFWSGTLPAATEKTMSDDLNRVRLYRNTVYGHVSGAMEISDDDFNDLWTKTSGALIRLANCISKEKKEEWQQAIEKLRTAPLTPEGEQNIQELKQWYESDYETKEMVERLHETVKMEFEEVREDMRQLKGVFS